MKKGIIILLCIGILFTLISCSKSNEMEGADGEFDLNYAPSENGSSGSPGGILGGTEGDMDTISPEEYGKFIENPFISTAETNVSTFSADVDTASYSYFRSLVRTGYSFTELKATASKNIRTEEMVNYFDYGYDAPENDDLFAASMQIAPCPWNEENDLLVLGLQAKEIEISEKNNLVFLIDVSGSMKSENKLPLLKKAFEYLTENLDSDDIISIVTYSGNEKVVLEGCSGAKKDKIINAVNSLSAGGSTNGEAGIQKAYAIAEKFFIPDGNNRIIMASDGDLNVGISSTTELEKFISEKRESNVFLSVLGFGSGNYKDEKMESIADHGNGVYYYIDSEEEAERVFGEKIFSTLYAIAKDVKLQLTFDPEYISSYRLIGYENRLLNPEDYLDDTKDAGELGVGHSLTVCYEIVTTDAAGATEDECEWMTLGVRYKAPDGDKSEEQNYSFGKESYSDTPDTNFKFISAVVSTSMLLHGSDYAVGITLESIKADLDELDLENDHYKLQFRELIGILAENPD